METSQFLLKWNNHQPTVVSVLDHLLSQEAFVDVTLACDGQSFSAHKVILSACSGYFQQLLMNTPCQHPIVVLKDVRARDLSALLQFMYRGEINVHQDDLAQFLRTAESLQIKGLADSAMKSEPDDGVDSVFPITAGTVATASASSSGGGGSLSSRRPRHSTESSLVSAAELTRTDPVTSELQKRSLGAAVGRSLLASALGHLVRPTLSADRSTIAAGGESPVSTASIVFPMELDAVSANSSSKASRISPPISLAASPSPSLTTPAVPSLVSSGSRSRSPTPSPPTSATSQVSGGQRVSHTAVGSAENGTENDLIVGDKTSGGVGPVVKAARLCPPLVSHPSLAATAAVAAAVAASAQAAAAAATPPFTPSTPLMCKYCGQMFSDASNRFRHEKRHKHPEEVHVCFVCKRPFSRKDNMKKHVKTVHGVSGDLEVGSAGVLGSWPSSTNWSDQASSGSNGSTTSAADTKSNGWAGANGGVISASSLQAVDMTTGR